MKEVKLNNGVSMPNLGLGTYLLSPKDAENSVKFALSNGYKLIDTANAYVNERAVGRGIKASGANRKDVFVSTKLWPTEYTNPRGIEQTLERLGLDYIDLLFLHQPAGDWKEGYRQLIKAYKQGKIRAIGISNFEGKYLEELFKEFDVVPQVIQVECHPLYPQTELREIIQDKDIKIMSWYPLGGKGMTDELINHPIINSLADKYHKTPVQIVLRWHVQMGFIVIPGSKNPEHIKSNIDIYDFALNKEDMKQMEKVCTNKRRFTRDDIKLAQFAKWQPTYEDK